MTVSKWIVIIILIYLKVWKVEFIFKKNWWDRLPTYNIYVLLKIVRSILQYTNPSILYYRLLQKLQNLLDIFFSTNLYNAWIANQSIDLFLLCFFLLQIYFRIFSVWVNIIIYKVFFCFRCTTTREYIIYTSESLRSQTYVRK